jgi:hypothetical protein
MGDTPPPPDCQSVVGIPKLLSYSAAKNCVNQLTRVLVGAPRDLGPPVRILSILER